ncbi:MAG TPA: protein phosphatase 2C domain-containing protein [Gemmataceae bacterium]|nr:protein phosphatase 2C domain-containing protein [Gemmataceae bacterium]
MSDDSQADTVDDLPALPAGPGPAGVPLRVDLWGLTHPGKVRPTNEDHFHIVQFGRYLRTLGSSLPDGEAPEEVGEAGHGFAVADGVGGNAGGETASRLALSLLVELILQTPDWVLSQQEDLLAKVMDRFAGRFQAVNSAVLAKAEDEPELRGMGTTLSLAVTRRDTLLVAHVGDSRAYLLRGGRLRRLTYDHTASRPVADPFGAGPTRFRRALTRAIGLPPSMAEPDLYHYRLEDGDRLLLCTDGLTDMVRDDTIAQELGRWPAAADACRTLVDLALANGGRDNVTVVVANYRRPTAGEDPAG